MRYGLRIAVRSLAHLLVIIIFTCSTSYGSSPEVSKSAPDNKANKLVDKKSGFEMGNNSCVISACLGKIKDKCEMNIDTMINSGPSVKSDIDENYFKEISLKSFQQIDQFNGQKIFITNGLKDPLAAQVNSFQQITGFSSLVREKLGNRVLYKYLTYEDEGHVPFYSLYDGLRFIYKAR